MNRFATMTAVFFAAATLMAPALAQDVTQDAPLADESPAPDMAPLTPEESAALAAALSDDPAAPARAARPLKIPGRSQQKNFDVTRSAQRYGAETYSFKRTLPSLNAKVGADLGTGAAPSTYYEPDRPIASADRNTGAAWASVDVTNTASVDARVDPSADQGRLATTLKHSMPLGGNYSLTLQNSSGVTNSMGAPTASAAPGVPLMTLPQAANTAAPSVWDDQPSVKFDVLSTGTSLSAGLARTSADTVTHNRLAAEQKLYGPLHLSTAVTDVGEATENKSISATIKFGW
ncbi:MAG: hypothetical protein ACTHLO_00135 [Pseudolabrys sp.]